jgi:hypothetical protein
MTNRIVAASVILAVAVCTAHSQQEGAKSEAEREPLKLYVGQSLADATEVIKRSGRKHGEGGSFRMVPDQWNLYVVADPNHADIYVFYSKSLSQVTRLSMAFFPSKQSGKAYYSWVTATEVLLRDDGSYSVHFAAPVADEELKKLETKHPKSEIPASRSDNAR